MQKSQRRFSSHEFHMIACNKIIWGWSVAVSINISIQWLTAKMRVQLFCCQKVILDLQIVTFHLFFAATWLLIAQLTIAYSTLQKLHQWMIRPCYHWVLQSLLSCLSKLSVFSTHQRHTFPCLEYSCAYFVAHSPSDFWSTLLVLSCCSSWD